MASAFLVHDRLWDVERAIKLLAHDSDELLDALQAEFSILAGLHHSSLVRVRDFSTFLKPQEGTEQRWAYYSYDYINGHGLDVFAKGARWSELLPIIRQLCQALLVLHNVGIRHGDVKPQNVLVTSGDDPRAVLIDLGCARPLRSVVETSGSESLCGTPGFLAPEQLEGRVADRRADLFALGVTLERISEHLSEPPPPPHQRLIERLRHPLRDQRPANMEEVLQELDVEPAAVHPVASLIGRFAGRSGVIQQCETALRSLGSGEGTTQRALILTGPAGVGQSRTLRELKWIAQRAFPVIETNSRSRSAIQWLLATTLGEPCDFNDTESLLKAFSRLEGISPTVWVIDDAHLLNEQQRSFVRTTLSAIEGRLPVLLLMAGHEQGLFELEGVTFVTLGPLTVGELESWLGEVLPIDVVESLHRISGGFPSILRALLAQLLSGATTEEALRRGEVRGILDSSSMDCREALDEPAQRGIGIFSAWNHSLSEAALQKLAIGRAQLQQLVEKGLVEADNVGWKLTRPGDRERVLDALEDDVTRGVYADLARWLEEEAAEATVVPAEEVALRVRYLALAGRLERAEALLRAEEERWGAAPRAWLEAIEALAARTEAPSVWLAAAVIERHAGHPRRALQRLDRLEAAGQAEGALVQVRVERGSCLLRLARPDEAIEQLEAAWAEASQSDRAAHIAAIFVRALCERGRVEEAVSIAEESLLTSQPLRQRADVLVAGGLALSMAGEVERALQWLDEAWSSLSSEDDLRRRVRAASTRAYVAYKVGDLEQAADDYDRAFELARVGGLDDHLATLTLNQGTLRHQQGQMGEALEAYERGLRVASALSQTGTEAMLLINHAKLNADLGLLELAQTMTERCRKRARAADLAILEPACDSVCGEIALAEGDFASAREHLERAMGGFVKAGALREQAETSLQLAELALVEGRIAEVGDALERSDELLQGLDARDVAARSRLLRLRWFVARGEGETAIPMIEAALVEAGQLGQLDFEAETEAVASRVWAARGASTIAEGHRRRSRELWERIAASLEVEVREAFWKHPRRRDARDTGTIAGVDNDGAPLIEPREGSRLHRLLEINKRLNSSLSTQEVLSRTMDAAIELTHAERGFLLLRMSSESGGVADALEVAVARNLDREQLQGPQMKFSRGIAQGVVETERALITADAQSDERLDTKASVHAMQLKSVICVPVRSPTGVLGALYLDNRFQRGRFRETDRDILLAFADQVAIALANARLHDELKRRNRDLEAERRRVEELLRGQAEEIERLNQVVERRRAGQGHRFDYGVIIGASRSLEDIFALLDRVIDTELPILIQGESGTGKELFARAVHDNSPRRSSGNLVSINCGALPEALLESELFGHVRGAFTGADRAREGLISRARGGTLFLDEVGEMPPAMQVKLLRVLQEREIQPLGSNQSLAVDFRLVCATNRDLRAEVEGGHFREDFYYRISAVSLTLPPLRERREDIPLLVRHFLARFAEEAGQERSELTGPALRRLLSYEWPGNVRQLEHVLTRAAVLCDEEKIRAADIELPRPKVQADERFSRKAFERAEVERIASALVEHRWNVSKVARVLDIPRPTLYRRIKRYGLKR